MRVQRDPLFKGGKLRYEITALNRKFPINGNKLDAEKISRLFQDLLNLNKYQREITGIVGGEQRQSDQYVLIGSNNKIADPEEYQKDLQELFASLPEIITPENIIPFKAKFKELYEKHIPIIDHRITPEQRQLNLEKAAEHETARKEELEAWRKIYCKDDTRVIIKDGEMAVCLSMTFDDSDAMTDYFDRHCQIHDDLLLAVVPRGPERESTCRKILARYPELAKLEWTWHSEKYSMGHGNYLMSEYCGSYNHRAYNGRNEVSIRWEISFDKYTRGEGLLCYRDYPGGKIDPAEPAAETAVSGVILSHNTQKNGIEVRFPSKPAAEILDKLRSSGFHWSNKFGVWYAPYSEVLFEEMKKYLIRPV